MDDLPRRAALGDACEEFGESWDERLRRYADHSQGRTSVEERAQDRGAGRRGRFPIKYYLTAMLFIIFDIEIVFLYPWAVTFDALGVFGLVEMLLFVLTVFVAYAYVWRRGGLEWD